jgi:membrane protein DedA with SNARE-associated domain/rhodanese-related sulfurtransferase
MNDIVNFLIRYGILLLFSVVFLEQIGLPLPSPPFLLAAGALAGRGEMNGVVALAVATLAALLADSIWFYLGRVRGSRVLKLLCRISLEPDSCVRRTEDVFERRGVKGIVTAKFIPGLGTLMPPLAGMFKVKFRRFLVFDGLGSLLYVGCFIALGMCFSSQLQQVVDALERLGRGALVLLVSLLVAYITFKSIQRQRVLRQMRMARITPEELRQRQEGGEELFIVDLRSEAAVQSDPSLIPGARHLLVAEVETWHHEIPRDREVVLYCSCPNEAGAAHAALVLYRRGITRVRPLLGGIDAWRERNYPLSRVPNTGITMETKLELGEHQTNE